MIRNILIFIFWGHIIINGFAQTVIIPNVPDHSQPPDTTLPSTKMNWSNYCAPYAYLNIIDYYENIYMHRNAQGIMAGLPADQTAEYIGWFLDTNDLGDPNRMNGSDPMLYPSASGTYIIDESVGMSNYAQFDISNTYGFPYQIPAQKTAYQWNITPPLPEDFPGFMSEINMGHLVKLDFLYWNPIPTGDSIVVPGENPETVHIYSWGPEIPDTGPLENVPFEEWNLLPQPPEQNIGHAVTGVGYIMDTLEFAIVHDNWASTDTNMAIPWRHMPSGTPYVTAMLLVTPPAVEINASLPDTLALSGTQIQIPLLVDDLTGLHVRSYYVYITFDPMVIRATGANTTNTLSAAWGTPNVNLSSLDRVIIDNSGSTDLFGFGNLLNIQFDVGGNVGDTTQLNFTTMVFNFGDPLPVTTNGSLVIVPRIVNVTITTEPTGLQVDVDGSSFTTPALFSWSEADTHQINAFSPQSAGAGIRYGYDSWNDGGSQQHVITVPPNDSTFMAAYFKEYELTTSVNPGNGGSVIVSPALSWFLEDSLAFLSAIADTNYTFSHWSGDLSGSENPDTLIMDNPKNVTANFSLIDAIDNQFQEAVPKEFALSQNFPNPFNPTTKINYQLPISSYVELSVYNILGTKIVTLVSEKQDAGYYLVEWNAAGFSSGVYFYRLQTDKNFTNTKKLLLIK